MQERIDQCITDHLQALTAEDRAEFLGSIDRLKTQLLTLMPEPAPN